MAYLELGSTPYDESCAQVGSDDYSTRAKEECERYKAQLEKMWPNARFSIKSFSHDFGSYYGVIVRYDENNKEEINLAFEIENDLPAKWIDN